MKTIIDTRDLYARQQELVALESALADAREERESVGGEPGSKAEEIEAADNAVESAESDFSDNELEELAKLNDLESEIPEWRHGETMVPASDWVDYVRDLLADIGDLPKDLPHYIAIDWDTTAENIKADYAEVEWDGETYYVRNA